MVTKGVQGEVPWLLRDFREVRMVTMGVQGTRAIVTDGAVGCAHITWEVRHGY